MLSQHIERDMATLVPNASLAQLQAFVIDFERERGFSEESIIQKCLLLGEEVGELFKAVRVESGMSVDPSSDVGSTAEELFGTSTRTLSRDTARPVRTDCATPPWRVV